MNFKTLEQTSISQITEVFNLAFENYFVPFKLTQQALVNKIRSENIDLRISVGAFKNENLVAFILIASGQVKNIKTFYNAGTGVIPSARNNQLTEKLYYFLLPKLKKLNFEQGILEVIDKNIQAIKVYQKVGYKITRTLPCYKMNGQNKNTKLKMEVIPFNSDQNTDFEKFWDWNPTWQNQTQILNHNSTNLKNILAKNDLNETIGYLCFDNSTGRIKQFAVIDRERRKGIATAMLSYLNILHQKKSMINVDGEDIATNNFLKKEGFKESLVQYEMVLKL